jgi:AraC-like DNA-binding protein
MRPARDEASFLRAPVGTYLFVGTSLMWVHSPTLCGSVGWGRPTADDTRAVLRTFDVFERLAPQFDVILDGSAIEKVDAPSLFLLLDWARTRIDELRRRVRLRFGVIADGVPAVTMAGISPALGGPGPVTLVRQAREAFRAVLPDGADALCDEVASLAAAARGLTPLLNKLRPLLDADRGRLLLAGAARRLGISARSLQRELQEAGNSYREEQQASRLRVAESLLGGEDKIATVAAQLGLTETGLTRLVRARTGLTPGELRRRLR